MEERPPRVLCVDDEPRVLDGLRRQLHGRFEVVTAVSGPAALDLLERGEPFAVVVADMRMPCMDGARFLGEVRERTPDTVRVLLTGHADFDAAVRAVNEGRIFRFLTKPCPRETFLPVLEEASAHYHHLKTSRDREAALSGDRQALDQLRSDFVSNVSHELRTPIAIVLGYADMLREGGAGRLSEEQERLLGVVDRNGRELLELVEALLHARGLQREGGSSAGTPEALPVADLVKMMEASLRGMAPPPSVTFGWNVSTPASAAVRVDPATVGLVIRNLVSNAFKFTAAGRVVVGVAPRGSHLAIEVSDTGMGIEPKDLPFIFDLFRQGDGSATRRHGGVGLGLYLVAECVRRISGRVEVTSAPGMGSTFRVIVPGYADAAPRGPGAHPAG